MRLLRVVVMMLVMSASALGTSWISLPSAYGQVDAVVGGTGAEDMKTLPDTLRMQVDLQVNGATSKEALEKYSRRKEAVAKLLTDAGATAESVKIGPPTLGLGTTSDQRMMQQMMRMSEGGATPETPKISTISFTAEASWPLKAATLEELILAAEPVLDKVEKADLMGESEMSEEEQEALEEARMAAEEYSYRETPTPGKPRFYYARKIAPEKILEMKKAAYKKAVAAAKELASIADRELGELAYLRDSVNPMGGSRDEDYSYYMLREMGYSGFTPEPAESGEVEAISPQLGEVTVSVQVMVGYALK